MPAKNTALCIAVALALPALSGLAKAADRTDENPKQGVHSHLVGAWEVDVPNAAGATHWVLEFRPDGTYTFYAPINAHAGTYTVSGDHWSLHATTTPYDDQGTFHLVNQQTLYFQGKYGADEWKRVATPPFFGEPTISEQRVPAGLRLLVTIEAANAREQWHADAIPVALRVLPQLPAHTTVFFKVTLRLYSPSTGAARDVTFSRYTRETRDFQAANVETHPITINFIDLPAAIASARGDGMRGPLRRAEIRGWKDFGAVWWIVGGKGGYQVAAATGKIIHGDVSSYILHYNAQWDQAIAGLESLLAKAMPQQPSGKGVRCSGMTIGMGIPCDPFFSAGVSGLDRWNCSMAGGYWGAGGCQ